MNDFPSLLNDIVWYTDAHRIPVVGPLLRSWFPVYSAHDTEREVGWVNGACMLVRQEVIKSVGGFDKYFFIFAEELDWCRRMWQAGWTVRFSPRVEVIHMLGGTFPSVDGRRTVLKYQAMLRYYRKHYPRRSTAPSGHTPGERRRQAGGARGHEPRRAGRGAPGPVPVGADDPAAREGGLAGHVPLLVAHHQGQPRGRPAPGMSSPVSSSRRIFFGEDALERFVEGWVVGGAVLPAVPDDVEPGAGHDADGVGVVLAAGGGVVVEAGGPGGWRGGSLRRSRRRRRGAACRQPSGR
jgi:Glycosyl transferase family group 2